MHANAAYNNLNARWNDYAAYWRKKHKYEMLIAEFECNQQLNHEPMLTSLVVDRVKNGTAGNIRNVSLMNISRYLRWAILSLEISSSPSNETDRHSS